MKTATEFLAAFQELPPKSREKVMAKILIDRINARAEQNIADASADYLTDSEVAAILRIKPDTLIRHLRNGPPRGRARNVIDVRLVRHVVVGGSRLWDRHSLMEALGQ